MSKVHFLRAAPDTQRGDNEHQASEARARPSEPLMDHNVAFPPHLLEMREIIPGWYWLRDKLRRTP